MYYTVTKDEKQDVKLYNCNECYKSFKTQKYVSQHYHVVHLKVRVEARKCPHCDLKIPANLRAFHLEDEHSIPAPTCGICAKRFAFQNKLWLHQKSTHMREKNVTCQVCNKDFFDNHGLKKHMASHLTERVYECNVCGKKFNWKSNLDAHLKIHTGRKPHQCKICGIAFAESRTLKCHIAKRHIGETK